MAMNSKGAMDWVKGLLSTERKKKRWGSTETQTSITIGGASQDGGSTAGSGTSTTMEFKPVPLIGHLPLRIQYAIGLVLLGANLIFALGCVGFYYTGLGTVTDAVTTATNMQTQIQRMAKNAQRAMVGDRGTFDVLASARESFVKDLANIRSATKTFDEYQAVKLNRELRKVERSWRGASRSVEGIVNNTQKLQDNARNASGAQEQSALLLDYLEQTLALMVQTGAGANEQAMANYGLLLSQRLTRTSTQLLLSDQVSQELSALVREDAKNLSRVLSVLERGDPNLGIRAATNAYVIERLKDTSRFYATFEKSVADLAANSSSVSVVKEGGIELITSSDKIAADLRVIVSEYEVKRLQVNLRAYVAGFFGILGLLSFAIIVFVNLKETQRQALESKQEKVATDAAIMRLLDEMGNLADGDLTSRATVTEEVTGAIADSVNFAITQLAELVGNIQSASSQMERATDRARETSSRLLKINEQQTHDITDTGRAVLQIAEAIEQVSKRMEDSKRVAEQSVANASRGSQAVNTSIEGIRAIETNVEETGKRIRRLTEQSQQISEIVDLIADISERTSVLAINATVQATKAGAAGKGFKVVADAVQELANQASEATRRIGALINAIQTDIQGAGSAMQKTTDEARRGAQLAEATGEALSEISDVSNALSDIVAEINEQVGQSAKAAAQVSQTMKRVLDSVNEASSTTRETGEAIEEVNTLSEKLRESVSGFKI